MTNSKPTPRPTNAQCFVGRKDNPIGYYPIYAKIGPTQIACLAKTDAHAVGFGISESEQTGNANLISEVFNVHHETGLTPRQLLEQRDEFLGLIQRAIDNAEEVIENMKSQSDSHHGIGFSTEEEKLWLAEAKAAIANCGGV